MLYVAQGQMRKKYHHPANVVLNSCVSGPVRESVSAAAAAATWSANQH